MFEAIQSQLGATITKLSTHCNQLEAENSQLRRQVHELTAALTTQKAAPPKGITLQYLAGLQRALLICKALYDAKPACAAIEEEINSIYADLKAGTSD